MKTSKMAIFKINCTTGFLADVYKNGGTNLSTRIPLDEIFNVVLTHFSRVCTHATVILNGENIRHYPHPSTQMENYLRTYYLGSSIK